MGLKRSTQIHDAVYARRFPILVRELQFSAAAKHSGRRHAAQHSRLDLIATRHHSAYLCHRADHALVYIGRTRHDLQRFVARCYGANLQMVAVFMRHDFKQLAHHNAVIRAVDALDALNAQPMHNHGTGQRLYIHIDINKIL